MARTLDSENVCTRCGVPDVHCFCPDVERQEPLPWTTLVFDQTKPLILRICPECSAALPAWTAAVVNHERWHRQSDGTDR